MFQPLRNVFSFCLFCFLENLYWSVKRYSHAFYYFLWVDIADKPVNSALQGRSGAQPAWGLQGDDYSPLGNVNGRLIWEESSVLEVPLSFFPSAVCLADNLLLTVNNHYYPCSLLLSLLKPIYAMQNLLGMDLDVERGLSEELCYSPRWCNIFLCPTGRPNDWPP